VGGLALNSLIAAGLALIKPLILWDVGFQLSFMATLGLIVLVLRATANFTPSGKRNWPKPD
jgi:predicted membrane metal-binding protein